MINGSPKGGKSNSGWLLEKLEEQLEGNHEVSRLNIVKKPAVDFQDLCRADVLVLAFPLYIDAIPSHMFRMMVALEQYMHDHPMEKDIAVYAIVNNGFYEGRQNHIALEIVKNW
jgi:multimeric flavodoxin WrbA